MLLAPDEPPAVTVLNENGRSPFLIACDHAGRRIPRRLGTLGLSPAELDRHIAWDIGVDPLSRIVSEAVDAMLVQQPYSRLVIDCNRPANVASSIPERSEDTAIPGNFRLTDAERRARIIEIFNPYHQRLAAELDRRSQARQRTVLLALHTFTPRYRLEVRPWQIGLLYNRDRRLARTLLGLLRDEIGLIVGDNQPYDVSDATDYTIPVHGEQRGLSHVGIEIRQDLVADPAGQRHWAMLLARLLPAAWELTTTQFAE